MDEFATADAAEGGPVPDALKALFNDPDGVKVQPLPCALPDEKSMGVHFAAGARTVPHRHENGQHLVITDGVGIVADEHAVHVVKAGDVVTNPPGGWHWHGATPTSAMSHVTVEGEDAGLDLDVEQRDWESTYTSDLGT
ncbi:cupin domain-containing protein [Kribbella endophytica]